MTSFTCRLSKREVSVHREETLHLLGLTPLSNFKAGTLSGGQKRKLSLGMFPLACFCDLLERKVTQRRGWFGKSCKNGSGGGVNDYFWGLGELRQWFYL